MFEIIEVNIKFKLVPMSWKPFFMRTFLKFKKKR